jgi:hypothetical protein
MVRAVTRVSFAHATCSRSRTRSNSVREHTHAATTANDRTAEPPCARPIRVPSSCLILPLLEDRKKWEEGREKNCAREAELARHARVASPPRCNAAVFGARTAHQVLLLTCLSPTRAPPRQPRSDGCLNGCIYVAPSFFRLVLPAFVGRRRSCRSSFCRMSR